MSSPPLWWCAAAFPTTPVPTPGRRPSGTSRRPRRRNWRPRTAGRFDKAIGTGDAAEIQRLYAVALAERGTLLDQFAPSTTDPLTPREQHGIALVDRPGADTGSEHRATLAEITADRGRPIGEGQYVIHDTEALRLPYLPDPYAQGVSLVFYEAGAPHLLPEAACVASGHRAVSGRVAELQPLRLVVEAGSELRARVEGHEVFVTLPPGEQVRVAMSSTVDQSSLDYFGLWRSHLASVVDPADGYTTDEVVAAAALMRAASSGWTWWLTPSVDVRLVHAVPAPVRPPRLSAMSLFLRPPGRSVAAFTGLVDVHGSSTDMVVVRASWTEQVDDVTAAGPQEVSKSDVVVRSPVGERQRTGVLFLFDFQPSGPLAQALGGVGFHKMLQTFEDTHYRRVTYVPAGTTRYAEYFEPSQLPEQTVEGEPVVLDIPSSARPAAPVVLDAVPLLRWEAETEPDEPFAWRQVRRSGVRIWLARPWFSSGDGELLGVLVFDTDEWVPGSDPNGLWTRRPKAQQAPDGATSLWGADPIAQHGGATSTATVPPLLTFDQLVLDAIETAAAESIAIRPPLHGEVYGGPRPGMDRRPWQSRRRRRGDPAARREGSSIGPGPGLSARVRRGLEAMVRRRRAARDAGALAVRAACRRPLPAALDRRQRALAGGPDELGAAAADADAHREPARPEARAGDVDRGGQLAAVGPALGAGVGRRTTERRQPDGRSCRTRRSVAAVANGAGDRPVPVGRCG